MSPEQCRGLNDEVDGATDVYALGCILFEMLCGRAPYVSPGWGDVLMMHMSDDIPVPSTDNPRVPPALDKVVRTALAKKKARSVLEHARHAPRARAVAQRRAGHAGADDEDRPADARDPARRRRAGASVGRGARAAAGATPAPAANDAFASQDGWRSSRDCGCGGSWSGQQSSSGPSWASRSLSGTRHRLQMSARAAPAPAAVVPPVAPAPPTREAAAPVTAQAAPNPTAADDDAAEQTTAAAKTNAGGRRRR